MIYLFCFLNFFAGSHAEAKDKLVIQKDETPYRDYNTGSLRTRRDFKLKLNKSTVDTETIKTLINAKHPGLLTYPTIYDAVQIGKDDVLILTTRDSQGAPYPVIRMTLNETNKLQAELLDIGANGSPYNWFPDSRLSEWTRVFGANDEYYMIRWSPFTFIKMGPGELAKVDYPYAFLIQTLKMKRASVFDLEKVVEIAHLDLDEDCFKLPSFNFDHPALERNDHTEDDNNVMYNYGPKWWDKNFEFSVGSSPSLKLRKIHSLPVPAKKLLAVLDPSREQVEPIDLFPLRGKDCSAINPQGIIKSNSLEATQESVWASDLCLGSVEGVDPGLKNKVCGKTEVQNFFSKYNLRLNEVSFTYTPLESGRPRVLISRLEFKVKDKSFAYLTGDSGEMDAIKKFKILNDTQVLIQARGDGPWNIYIETANQSAQGFELQKIGSFAYPGTDFEEMNEGKFLYSQSGRILVQKNPVAYWIEQAGIVAVKGDRTFIFYREGRRSDEGDPVFAAINLAGVKDPYGLRDNIIFQGKLSKSCFEKLGFPPLNASLKQKEEWFNLNLTWSESAKSLKSKSCSITRL